MKSLLGLLMFLTCLASSTLFSQEKRVGAKLEWSKVFEPNDYGITSTIGENLGAQVNLDYLDFLGLPKAWY